MKPNVRYGHRRVVLLALILSVLFLTCAEIIPPPGGPEDKTGPALLGSVPGNGDTLVAPGNTITLLFSEPLTKPRSGRSIYISPRPETEPEVKWKSDQITIKLADSFQTDQTYIVSVNSSVTDLRGNRLDTSATVAFTTGTTIATGVVSGHVYADPDKPQGGVIAALYELPDSTDSIAYDSTYPEYITTSSQDGYFALRYLPKKTYRMIVFDDKNRDERFNPFRESFALPDRPVDLSSEIRLDDLMMFMTSLDTTRPAVLNASYSADKIVRIRLSRAVGLTYLRRHPSEIRLLLQSDSNKVVPAVAFLESGEDESATIQTYFGDIPVGDYTLMIRYDSVLLPLEFMPLSVSPREDRTKPIIDDFKPEDKPLFARDIHMRFTFSEPLDTSVTGDQSLLLWFGDSIQVPITKRWTDPFHLEIFPVDSLSAGKYKLQLTEFDFVDFAGNLLGDSLRTYRFSVLDADSLGSITGNLAVRMPLAHVAPINLWFRKVENQQLFEHKTDSTGFTITVPAGKYLLSGFIDANSDGRLNRGALWPFTYSETVGQYSDTIAVRARFETTGIRLEFD